MKTSQFERATAAQLQQMIYCLDRYEYTPGQLEIYLTWAESSSVVPPSITLAHMCATGEKNAEYWS